MDPERAKNEFAKVGNAFEILKDPEKRREYDMTGRVGGAGGGGGPGHAGVSAEHQRMVHEWMQAMMRQQQQQRAPPKPFPSVDMEAWIRPDVGAIERASRASGISTERDGVRARFAGTLGVVSAVDSQDESVKVRVVVSVGRAAEIWFGASALWDPRRLEAGLDVRIVADVEAAHRASRASGIDAENDERRARCAGKAGTVIKVDRDDQTAKVRVSVSHTKADELWFGVGAIEPVS
tara:strand:- start:2014 stop:2721 length:708 start_codon:yes stop_codon:yes gene_type:complete